MSSPGLNIEPREMGRSEERVKLAIDPSGGGGGGGLVLVWMPGDETHKVKSMSCCDCSPVLLRFSCFCFVSLLHH